VPTLQLAGSVAICPRECFSRDGFQGPYAVSDLVDRDCDDQLVGGEAVNERGQAALDLPGVPPHPALAQDRYHLPLPRRECVPGGLIRREQRRVLSG
jgi:hypothetical protein